MINVEWHDSLMAMPPKERQAELRRVCQELEGVFLRQLIETMRAGGRGEGLFETSPGEEIFTSLLDDHFASVAAQKMERGIGEALYRQLSRQLALEDPSCQDTHR
jgi:flagellar protein FlgJ